MLQPSRVKYRKAHRGDRRGTATRGATLAFGEVGLQAQEAVWLSARQIEAARRVIVRYLRRGGNMWIRVFPDKPVTAKPAETRMGSGKGAPDHWVAVVKRGRMIFEVAGIDPKQAKEALLLASHKLPIPCSIIERQVIEKAPAAAEAEMAS